MPVDVPTLLSATSLVIAFSGALLMLLQGRSAWTPLGTWGLAMLTGAAGLWLLAGEGALPPWLSDGVSHTLLLLAPAFSWTAARLFEGRKPMIAWVSAGSAAWLLAFGLRDSLPPALMVNLPYPIGAAYTLATTLELWRGRSEPLPSRPFALGLLALHTALYAGRALASPFLTESVVPVSAGVRVFVIYEGLLHTLGMAFALFAMAAERAEQQTNRALRELALSDPLTGLANRRRFDETLALELRRAARIHAPLSVLMIDVDHFKHFNDQYGHPRGDAALRRLARALAAELRRPGDLAARYGGEELIVLLPLTNGAGALAVAERICVAIRALGIENAGTPSGRVTVSVGIAVVVPNSGQLDAEALIMAADEALYRAKAGGRDRIASAGPIVPGALSLRESGADRPRPPLPS